MKIPGVRRRTAAAGNAFLNDESVRNFNKSFRTYEDEPSFLGPPALDDANSDEDDDAISHSATVAPSEIPPARPIDPPPPIVRCHQNALRQTAFMDELEALIRLLTSKQTNIEQRMHKAFPKGAPVHLLPLDPKTAARIPQVSGDPRDRPRATVPPRPRGKGAAARPETAETAGAAGQEASAETVAARGGTGAPYLFAV